MISLIAHRNLRAITASLFLFSDLLCINESNPIDFCNRKQRPPRIQKTLRGRSWTRTTAVVEIQGLVKSPEKQKKAVTKSKGCIARGLLERGCK